MDDSQGAKRVRVMNTRAIAWMMLLLLTAAGLAFLYGQHASPAGYGAVRSVDEPSSIALARTGDQPIDALETLPSTPLKSVAVDNREAVSAQEGTAASQDAESSQWIRRLDSARNRFELALNGNDGDAAGAALSLVSLSILSRLERDGQYAVIPSGERVKLLGGNVPADERRMAFGDRMYFFKAAEYPLFDEVQKAMDTAAKAGTNGPQANTITADLIGAIDLLYTETRQHLEPSKPAK